MKKYEVDDVIEFLIPFFEQKENSTENLKLLLNMLMMLQIKKLYEQAYNRGYEAIEKHKEEAKKWIS